MAIAALLPKAVRRARSSPLNALGPRFESRYRTANAFNMLGKRDKACDILNMTLVLHPDLGSDDLKDKYLELKSEICKEGL